MYTDKLDWDARCVSHNKMNKTVLKLNLYGAYYVRPTWHPNLVIYYNASPRTHLAFPTYHEQRLPIMKHFIDSLIFFLYMMKRTTLTPKYYTHYRVGTVFNHELHKNVSCMIKFIMVQVVDSYQIKKLSKYNFPLSI